MWASPYYEYQPKRVKDATIASPSVPTSRGNNDLDQLSSPSMTDLLEPAVDGPPSPERLRQLSKQMKRASHLQRSLGHRTASSSSSSIQSLGDRPAWEQALDNMSLSRRPSNRSTDSSTPSRDRPESVQVFGRNIFQRRGAKLRRESSAQSSGNSSLHSGEVPGDNAANGLRDSLMPTLFARRKPSRDDSAQRRLQISGPFNFQHVTHTPRDDVSDTQRGSRMELAAELSAMRTPGPTTAPSALRNNEAHGIQSRAPSSDSAGETEAPLTAPISRPALVPRHTAPASGPRRLMKQARSQDHLRVRASPPRSAPQRPPRSPLDPPSEPPLPPVPPPRVSSRQSLQLDAFATTPLGRPQTSGGFHRPQPFNPTDSGERSPPPPATSHGHGPTNDFEAFGARDKRVSLSPTTPEQAWPLASPVASSFDSTLADVPEEEEVYGVSRRSRLSLASNNSSLRGSHSVPMLRSLAQSQRPMSGASETLGRSDMAAAQRAMRMGLEEDLEEEDYDPRSIRESWEDDIDYCYEHEAEADCDYEWERPSLDVHRDDHPTHGNVALAVVDELAEAQPMTGTAISSPDRREASRSTSRSDVRTLSPSSPGPAGVGSPEAVSPLATSPTNNFSLPLGDRKKGNRPAMLKPTRPISMASSFKESQGFTLSPSLLIPGDYHQQMLQSEVERYKYPEGDEPPSRGFQMAYIEGATARIKSPLANEQRSSTSTTETTSTSHSDSTGERHTSTNSTWTTVSRLTASSTSLNKMAASWTETSEATPTTHFVDADDDEETTEQESTPPASQDTVPELTPFPIMGLKRSFHKSHASESVARIDAPAVKSQEALTTRRPRARTASLSTQAPPVGQYALFPRQFVKGTHTGDRI